jgi:hypothetical protein
MCYADFEQAIKSPSLRQVARHWNEARGKRAMPAWKEIDPSRITSQLSIIWSYRFDRESDAFVGRLAGDQIEKVFCRTFRGTRMEDLYPADQFTLMHHRFRRVVCEPALYVEEGKVFQVVDSYGYGERIAMPLSKNGITGDGILGATVYEAFRATDAQPSSDEVCWFAL